SHHHRYSYSRSRTFPSRNNEMAVEGSDTGALPPTCLCDGTCLPALKRTGCTASQLNQLYLPRTELIGFGTSLPTQQTDRTNWSFLFTIWAEQTGHLSSHNIKTSYCIVFRCCSYHSVLDS